VLQVVDDAFAVLEGQLLLRRFILEGDLQALVQVARDLEALLDEGGSNSILGKIAASG
jgi:hypothetical protein